jgi:hypothetical protein
VKTLHRLHLWAILINRILRDSDLTRFSLRNNVTGSSKDQKLTYSTAVSMNYSKNNQPTSIGTNGVNQNPLLSLSSLPYLTLR